MDRTRVLNWSDSRLVYNELRLTVSRSGSRKNNQGVQLGPCRRRLQVQMWHRHSRLDLTRRCLRAGKLWPKWRTSLLHGAFSWKHWLADRGAARILGGRLRTFWLSWINRTVFTSRCDVAPLLGYKQAWILSVCCILRWWNLSKRANEVHCHEFDLCVNHDADGLTSCECANQVRQNPKQRLPGQSERSQLVPRNHRRLDGRTQLLHKKIL